MRMKIRKTLCTALSSVLIAGLLILTLLKRPRQNNITVENTAN